MSVERQFEVVLQPEPQGGFSVFVPQLPGCASQGETKEEALAMIKEAIEGYLESLDEHDDPIPESTDRPIEVERVTVGVWPRDCRPYPRAMRPECSRDPAGSSTAPKGVITFFGTRIGPTAW